MCFLELRRNVSVRGDCGEEDVKIVCDMQYSISIYIIN